MERWTPVTLKRKERRDLVVTVRDSITIVEKTNGGDVSVFFLSELEEYIKILQTAYILLNGDGNKW
jgi:hypothetical protein